ncbi:MAG: hypothetical protein IJV01_03505 [Bacteroidales bacterium]|nr:hypothetical protein [Bacteroidales bacterium]
MEDERKLYPIRFQPLEDKYSWGSESFLLADLGYRDSIVRDGWLSANALSELMETYLDRLVGERVFDWYGQQFPFQVKRLKVRGRMPLRVHPDDETARPRYDALGKEKFWYVTAAGQDACALAGFGKACDAEEFYLACLENRPEEWLQRLPLRKGQWLHIPPGMPHAVLGDAELIEVSESSGLDFWLCGWGEPLSETEFDPEMSLSDALDFIDFTPADAASILGLAKAGRGEELLTLPQFSVRRILLKDKAESYALLPDDSCRAYLCLSGSCSVETAPDGVRGCYSLAAGELLLLPAECSDYLLIPGERAELLELRVDRREEHDPYIMSNGSDARR